MPMYDRRLEAQDQPGKRPLDQSHPYYGPDPVAMREQIRDQPKPYARGFWARLRAWLGG